MEAWLAELEAGRREAAWDTFLDRYRRLLFATIRHFVEDYDDVMDVFAHVCEALREDDFRRLRSYARHEGSRARFSTWLVVVVRNLAVDCMRQRHGRPRQPAVAEGLPALQKLIYEHVFGAGRSHLEAYEVIRSRDDPELTFGRFLKELATVYRTVTPSSGRLPGAFSASPPPAVGGTQ